MRSKLFRKFANAAAAGAGSPLSFIACVAFVLVWALTGPLFGFSDTWQLVINTSTTIITFLMVFLIQNTQNRDNGALQAKLDELIRAMVDADSRFSASNISPTRSSGLSSRTLRRARACFTKNASGA